ncbi:MAG: cobalamin-dependent protein, partial [Caldilineaceae bacterium]
MRIILASPEAKVWSARKHIPLGLGYLAAVLREGGHDVMIFDAAVEDVGVDYYLDLAEEEGRPYELIGITATTPLIQEAWEMAQLCKGRGLHTVLGGPHLTIMPLESLEAPHDGYVDYVFRGEAEYSFLELVNLLEAGKEPGVIPGIQFKRNGEIVSSPESPMIPDLDALPFPAHDLFKIDRYTNLQPLTDGL